MLIREIKNRMLGWLQKLWINPWFSPPSAALSPVPLSPPKKQQGSALVMAAIFMVIATFLMTVAGKLVSSASNDAKKRVLLVAEAENIAKAGLMDAKGWFLRQTANNGLVSAYNVSTGNVLAGQTPSSWNLSPAGTAYTFPDQAFWPVNNTFNGQASDSAEPWIGITEEYPLDSPVSATAKFWGRYEVHKQLAAPTPPATWDPYAVHDISGNRNSVSLQNGDGAEWSIVSTGYVYQRNDYTTVNGMWKYPYNDAHNKILASARFSTEYVKLGCNLPTMFTAITAAVYADKSSYVTLSGNSNTLINGNAAPPGSYPLVTMNP